MSEAGGAAFKAAMEGTLVGMGDAHGRVTQSLQKVKQDLVELTGKSLEEVVTFGSGSVNNGRNDVTTILAPAEGADTVLIVTH
jgi:hypothetical protein